MIPSSPYSSAFDLEAQHYDERFNALPETRILRGWIWRQLQSAFMPGSVVLDVGCGTGEDAAMLSDHGAAVIAIDVSPAMIACAQAKHQGPDFRVCDVRDFERSGDLAIGRLGDLSEDCQPQSLNKSLNRQIAKSPNVLDGILSNFGALNCLHSLDPVRRLADHHLRPGGLLFLVLINRWYLRELAAFEFRRLRSSGSPVRCGGRQLPLFYHPPRTLRWRGYARERLVALGSWSRSDVQTRWPLNRLGDHYLAVLRKR